MDLNSILCKVPDIKSILSDFKHYKANVKSSPDTVDIIEELLQDMLTMLGSIPICDACVQCNKKDKNEINLCKVHTTEYDHWTTVYDLLIELHKLHNGGALSVREVRLPNDTFLLIPYAGTEHMYYIYLISPLKKYDMRYICRSMKFNI